MHPGKISMTEDAKGPRRRGAGPEGRRPAEQEGGDARAVEVLELLLSFAVPSKKAGSALARRLQKRFGGLRGVLDAQPGELEAIEGLDPRAASLIALMKPLAASYLRERIADRDIIRDHRDVVNYLKLSLSAERTEKFLGLYLNSRGELLAVEVLHEGALSHSAVYARCAIEPAMRHGASSVIFVHNHPGGDPAPSPDDCELMRRLEKAAAAVDLVVHDHMIVGRTSLFSARASNWPFEGQRPHSRAAEKDRQDR